MRRFRNLLVRMLSLVIGLTPVQGAVAGLLATVDHDEATEIHSVIARDEADSGVTSDHGYTQQACEHCLYSGCCAGTSCNAGHCASSAAAVTTFTPQADLRTHLVEVEHDPAIVKYVPTLPFRPPIS